MRKAAVDNDILYKGVCYGLMREIVGAIPALPRETLILGHAKFVIGRRLERNTTRSVPGAAKALDTFNEMLRELLQVEPSADEQTLAAEFENAAQATGLALDSGESLLCALMVCRGVERLATGDKRAICSLEVLLGRDNRLTVLAGRIVCLEQLFVRMLACHDAEAIRAAVCNQHQVDKSLTICFSCSTPGDRVDVWLAGLACYIKALRAEAPTLLEA